ncbi:MAG: tetratricopeptide repeat protein [Polyangiaceae bacterium]
MHLHRQAREPGAIDWRALTRPSAAAAHGTVAARTRDNLGHPMAALVERSVRRRFRLWVMVASLVGSALPASFVDRALAQEASPEARAQDLFARSVRLYGERRFPEAVALLEQAYALDPKPVLLYNIARAHQESGDARRAIDAFRRYLTADPEASDHDAVTARIAALEREVEVEPPARRPLAARPPAEGERTADAAARPAGHQPSALPWIVAGVGGAGAAAGLVLYGLAQGAGSDAVEEGSAARAREDEARGQDLLTASRVTLGVSGVLAVVGLTWGTIDLATAPTSAPSATGPRRSAVRVSLGACSLALDGSF